MNLYPLVSIIIPTYNRAALLQKAIQTVRNQTYPNWQCIVCDDFSTDNTKVVLQGLTLEDKRIEYVVNQFTKGAPGARNTGLEKANGVYVLFLDSDDLLLPHCIKSRLSYFLKYPDLDIVVGMQGLLKNGEDAGLINIPSEFPPLVRFFSLYPNNDIPWINNTLIKTSFLKDNKITWNTGVKVHQDIQFNISMLSHDPKLLWSTYPVDSYWVSMSTHHHIGSQKHEELSIFKKLVECYWHTIKNNSLPESTMRTVRQQYKALLLDICYKVSFMEKRLFLDFLDFVKKHSDFKSWDVFFIYHRFIVKNNALSLPKKILRKMSGIYLEQYVEPVIKAGGFLKNDTFPVGQPGV
ncbi:hypothetical protein BH11BAC3_BH11BAC3_19520 [soil metagenome]